MQRILKISVIIIINFILISIFYIAINQKIYKYYAKMREESFYSAPQFKLIPYPDSYNIEVYNDNYFDGNKEKGRLPNGMEYQDKPPVILFGCSFAYGAFLDENSNFSGKLSNQLKRTVYNRAIRGAGLQHMLYANRFP